MPRHAWWRGERDDMATIRPLIDDVAWSAALPILTWLCRTLISGTVEPDIGPRPSPSLILSMLSLII